MTAPSNISPIHSGNERALMLAISSQVARNKAVPPHPTHSASGRWAVITFASLGALLQSVVDLPLVLLLQQIIELLGFRIRLLFQDGLVGLQHAFYR